MVYLYLLFVCTQIHVAQFLAYTQFNIQDSWKYVLQKPVIQLCYWIVGGLEIDADELELSFLSLCRD